MLSLSLARHLWCIHLSSILRISFITGSYDRTCKVWDTASGEELHTLEGHRNVVYAIAFNNPFGSAIATVRVCKDVSNSSLSSVDKKGVHLNICSYMYFLTLQR